MVSALKLLLRCRVRCTITVVAQHISITHLGSLPQLDAFVSAEQESQVRTMTGVNWSPHADISSTQERILVFAAWTIKTRRTYTKSMLGDLSVCIIGWKLPNKRPHYEGKLNEIVLVVSPRSLFPERTLRVEENPRGDRAIIYCSIADASPGTATFLQVVSKNCFLRYTVD